MYLDKCSELEVLDDCEENNMKKLVETFEPSKINFDERMKEVEEAIWSTSAAMLRR